MDTDRFDKQIAFLLEIDKVKSVFRRTRLLDDSRHENDAEHAWHLGVMSMVLSEYANERRLDAGKVIRMVLLHDLVEIDAGDTFVYDTKGRASAPGREARAADRIFALLPDDQRDEFRALWDEFEARQTSEARFAAAIDRLEPILQNVHTGGHAWQKHGITRAQVQAANQHIGEGSEELWQYVQELFEACDRSGYFAPPPVGDVQT